MAYLSGSSLRTFLVGGALIIICLGSATKTWLAAEQGRQQEATASVDSIVFVERGERVAMPEVTATFEHEDQLIKTVFLDVENRLGTGDQFAIRYDRANPADAVPAWQAATDRDGQRLLAACLLVAALIAFALMRTERQVTEHETGKGYHAQPWGA